MFVYVISKDGQPLMPTSRFGKVRRLLKNKKAKVIRSCPFTIKLLYEPESLVVQEIVLGQDTGSRYVGTACVANNKVLYQSEVMLRDACVIASGGKEFEQSNWLFKKRRVAKQNRQLRKGVRGEKKLPIGKIFGFKRFDKVKYLKEICFIKSRRNSGAFTLMDVDNNTIDFRDRGGRGHPSYKLLERLNTRRSILCISQRI